MLLMLFGAAFALPCDHAVTQADLNRCATQAWQVADAEMSRQWRDTYAVMKRHDSDGGSGHARMTLESQRAWLKFRDAQCTAVSSKLNGGSAQPMERAGCLERLTRDRTAQLKAMIW